MGKITGLGHVALRTADIEKSLAFYKLLGAEDDVVYASIPKPTGTTRLAMFTIGGFIIELIQPGDGVVAENRPDQNWAHLCFAVEDVDALVDSLRAKGIDTFLTPTPNSAPLFGGIRNINLTGPSGELIELSQNER